MKVNYDNGDHIGFCFLVNETVIQTMTIQKTVIYIDSMKDSDLIDKIMCWGYLHPVVEKVVELTNWNFNSITWNQMFE